MLAVLIAWVSNTPEYARRSTSYASLKPRCWRIGDTTRLPEVAQLWLVPKAILVELPFAGPLLFYKLVTQAEHVVFERFEHFEKATYRNRCHIAGPDGLVRLSIPIQHGRSHRQIVAETRISGDHNWRQQHWKSLETAYRRSPYFEFYEADLKDVYDQPWALLFDFNLQIHAFAMHALGLPLGHSVSESYEKNPEANDMRSHFLPGMDATDAPVYHQVFQDRHGFLPNLSVLDLLFNVGPRTVDVLLSR